MNEKGLLAILQGVAGYLERDPLLISEAGRTALLNRTAGLAGKIREADDRLVIGLVGGTGVGKSTLINALAGEVISPGTDLRPTTNHAVLYKHRENPFSMNGAEDVHLHDAEALKRVSLVDFPDFDSIEPAHREILSRHFPRLDLLLWVTDPVKYADQAFFDWLADAPQAEANSVFVFNKTDEFEKRYGRRAPDIIGETVLDFRQKLERHAGLANPGVFAVSALSEIEKQDGPGREGFSRLRTMIAGLQEKKLRLSIKNLNANAMTRDLMADLEAEASLAAVERGLERLGQCLAQGRTDIENLVRSEGEALVTLLKRPWRAGLTAGARDQAPWPLDFFMFVWEKFTGLFRKNRPVQDPLQRMPRPELAALKRRLDSLVSECGLAFSPDDPPAAKAVQDGLSRLAGSEDIVQTASARMLNEAMTRAERIKKRYRWKIRHHILPLLILAWPFLPFVFGWVSGIVSGAKTAPEVIINVGWSDILPLAEMILAVYLVSTVYFVYAVDRAATRSLYELAAGWVGFVQNHIAQNIFEEMVKVDRALRTEIATVKKLAADSPPGE